MIRGMRKMSQREFAQALSERGMKIDPPAVSRIENGVRAVRLSEALVVAEVLDVELSSLVNGADETPTQQLRRARRVASSSQVSLRPVLVEFINNYLWVEEVLEDHPEVLVEIGEPGAGIQSPLEYFPWVATKIAELEAQRRATAEIDVDAEYVSYPSKAHARGIKDVVGALVDAVLASREEFDELVEAVDRRAIERYERRMQEDRRGQAPDSDQ